MKSWSSGFELATSGWFPAGLKFNFGWLVKSFQDFQVPRLLWFHDFGASERYIWCWRLTKCWANKGSMCDQLLGKRDQDHHGTVKNASTWSTCLARCPNFAQLYMTLTYFDSPVSTCAQVSMPCLELFKMQAPGKVGQVVASHGQCKSPGIFRWPRCSDYIDEVLPRQCRARVSIEAGRHHSWGSLIGIESWTERSPKLNGHLMWLGSPQEVGPPNCLWALDQPPWHVFTQPFQWNWTDSNQTNLHIDIALQPFSSEAWHGHLCHTQE